jgi:hypothetical protein
MSDRDQFEDMLRRANADYTIVTPGEWATTEITVQNWCKHPGRDLGYSMFFSCWFFNADGALIGVGHWE